MQQNIFQQIYLHPALEASDVAMLGAAHKKIEFVKGHIFLEAGKAANEYFLLSSGLVRAHVIDFKGEEVTTDFFSAGSIVIEVSSLFQRITSQENIVALTDGVAWKIDFDTFQKLFHQLPGFWEWGRAWMSQQLFISKQRSIDMLTKSATERYLILLQQKPEIVMQAPLKYIASYLGITDTSLSRIRKEISE